MLLKSLNITAAKAAESLERIDKVLEHVGSLLADGRPYLAGTPLPRPYLAFPTSPLSPAPSLPLSLDVHVVRFSLSLLVLAASLAHQDTAGVNNRG